MNGTLTLNTSAAQITFSDTILVRDGVANTLALRNGANLQNFRIYGTYTDAGNNEYLSFESGSTVFDIKTVANGIGTANSLRLGTGGTARWQIDTSGHYTAVTDNTYDIGASGANRPRSIYVGTAGTFGGNVTAATLVAGATEFFRITGRANIGASADGIIYLADSAATSINRVCWGGTTSSFPSIKRSSATLQARLADDSAFALFECSQIKTNNGTALVSGTALTNGAAAQVGTLTNAPAAGNPTKWIPIDDNGTTRYIPTW